MDSEPQRVGDSRAFAKLMQHQSARKAWETANPEIAADWNAALEEDDRRTREKEIAARNAAHDADLPGELRGLGFPIDAIEALARLEDSTLIQTARRFVAAPTASQGRFMVLLGRRGTGKTVAAAFVAREILRRRRRDWATGEMPMHLPVEFVLASTFARISGYSAEDKGWFTRLCEVSLLVLDDLGAEHLGPYGAAMLDECLTRRHGSRLRTAITTNLSKDAFKARVGERLFDRISTSGMSAVSVGDSLRRKGTS